MRKLITLAVALMISSICFAQKDVTKFLGIPVDGTKSAMIQKLKSKGFTYNQQKDCLEGEFNGREVKIYVVTNNNKVYRIMVKDAYGEDESSIKIRFNTLCKQFENNSKYLPATFEESHIIGEDEKISYEMLVHKKRYQASFCQTSKETIDTAAFTDYFYSKVSELYTEEELSHLTEEQEETIKTKVALLYATELLTKNSVWFMIEEEYGYYRILLFYDNGYNQANGEDL